MNADLLGSDNALRLLRKCLDGTKDAVPRTIRFIIPSVYGQISRTDIFNIRMADCQWLEACASFSKPLQIYKGTSSKLRVDIHLSEIFKLAVAGLLFRPVNDSERSREILIALHADLVNRLSFPWLIDTPVPRKTIAIVEGCHVHPKDGGYAPMIYEGAKALGIDVVVLDNEGHWLQGPEFADWRVEFIPFDLPDEPDEQLGRRIAEKIRSCERKIDGILTPSEYYKYQIADACQHLGLPTMPPEAYAIVIDKHKTSMFVGIDSHLVTSAEEAVALADAKSLEFPLIVKPCLGWSSNGVTRVDSAADIPQAFAAIDVNVHGTNVLLEPYCDGPEVDYNVVLWNGEILFDELCDDLPKSAELLGSNNGTFKETDSPFPSILPAPEIELIRNDFCDVLRRMGFTTGLFHIEGRVHHSTVEFVLRDGVQHMQKRIYTGSAAQTHPRGPKPWLHEINPRPPGMTASKIISTTYGVEYWGLVLLLAIHDEARTRALTQPYLNGPQYHCVMVFITNEFDNTKYEGVFNSDDICEELCARRPDIAEKVSDMACFVKRGDRVPHCSTGENIFLAHINVYSRDGREEAMKLANEVRRELRIEWK